MEEQHVDVAGVVELPTAELPHRDDPEPDVRRDEFERAADAHLGQSRQLPGDHGKVGSAEQIARRDAQKLAPLPPAQRARAVISGGEERGGGVAVLGERALVREALAVAQRVEQRRVTQDCARQRARRRAQRDERVAHEWVRGQLVPERRVIVEQPRQERPGRRRVG